MIYLMPNIYYSRCKKSCHQKQDFTMQWDVAVECTSDNKVFAQNGTQTTHCISGSILWLCTGSIFTFPFQTIFAQGLLMLFWNALSPVLCRCGFRKMIKKHPSTKIKSVRFCPNYFWDQFSTVITSEVWNYIRDSHNLEYF